MVFSQKEKNFSALGFGEVMLRLSTPSYGRITHSESFDKSAGGSELNVVSGISMLGMRTGIITKLPKSEIGKFVKYKVRYSGTSDDYIIYDSSKNARLGIYYYECGAYPRPSAVSYDRLASSFTSFDKEELPESIYSKTQIFHTSGITLALGEKTRKNVTEMMTLFKEGGALISFDVNYRAALWSEEEAKEAIFEVLPLVDILFISEETLRRTFGFSGEIKDIHKTFAGNFTNLGIIASTKREARSPRRHTFSSLVYDCKEDAHYEEEPYRDIDVVDRIGSGDAYVAGALYGLLKFADIRKIAEYGNAMAALKNTVMGDMTECDLADIEGIIERHTGIGPKSEMLR